QAADSIVVIDGDTSGFVEFNDRTHENLGYTREEFQALTIADLDVLESPEDVAEHAAKIIDEGAGTFETKMQGKDGELHDVQVDARAISVGGKTFIASIWHDITDRRRAEEKIRQLNAELEQRVAERTADLRKAIRDLRHEARQRSRAEEALVERSRALDAFFQHSLTPLVILDREFNFIRVNEAYARAGARDVSEFPGRNHFDLYPSDAKAIFEEVVRTRKPFQTVARPFAYPDHPEWGVTYWDWTLVPLLDDDGEVESLVFSLKDVTGSVGRASFGPWRWS
ncbi:MAG: PAS domain-containing protein, partial [Planctomycetota bacterium]